MSQEILKEYGALIGRIEKTPDRRRTRRTLFSDGELREILTFIYEELCRWLDRRTCDRVSFNWCESVATRLTDCVDILLRMRHGFPNDAETLQFIGAAVFTHVYESVRMLLGLDPKASVGAYGDEDEHVLNGKIFCVDTLSICESSRPEQMPRRILEDDHYFLRSRCRKLAGNMLPYMKTAETTGRNKFCFSTTLFLHNFLKGYDPEISLALANTFYKELTEKRAEYPTVEGLSHAELIMGNFIFSVKLALEKTHPLKEMVTLNFFVCRKEPENPAAPA